MELSVAANQLKPGDFVIDESGERKVVRVERGGLGWTIRYVDGSSTYVDRPEATAVLIRREDDVDSEIKKLSEKLRENDRPAG